MMSLNKKISIFSIAVFLTSDIVCAQVVITEVMYDPAHTDTDHEWVEIYNSGSQNIDLTGWKFNDGSNHTLYPPPQKGGRGSLIVPQGGYIIFAQDAATFISDYAGFSGSVVDCAMNLLNTKSVTLTLLSKDESTADSMSYDKSLSASDDGNSLQKVNGIWKSLLPTPGMANTNSEVAPVQTGQASSSATTTSSNVSTETTVSVSGSNTYDWPAEPQIMSRIIGPSAAIVGADVVFKGEALGLDKRPLQNPRFSWNFGDGSAKEGESVFHIYNFPGEYAVILEVSSGKYESSSRLKIKAFPADISIEGVVSGINGKIELVNNSKQELDLSWWRLKSGPNFFTLPKNTKILSEGRLPISAAVMGFPVDDLNLALLYPNGVESKRFDARSAAPVIAYVQPISAAPEIPEKKSEMAVIAKADSKIAVSGASTDNRVLSQTAAALETSGIATNGNNPSPVKAEKSSLSLWLYGVGGIVILALGFVFAPKSKEMPKNGSEEYKIIDS